MRQGPVQVADQILEELPLEAPPQPLYILIQSIIQANGWSVDATEKAKEWETPVRSRLETHCQVAYQQMRQPRIAFNSSSKYMIQGACFIERKDDPAIREQKIQRLRWNDYYQVLRDLEPRQFETFCARIIKVLGAKDVILTPSTRDEGIDFFGRLSLADMIGHRPIFRTFQSYLEVWLVGQAKHYRAVRVATPDLRELVGSVTLARHHTFSAVETAKYSELSVRACDPIFMLFFTTGEISGDGWRLINRSGIAAMDGESLALFLADNDIGLIDSPQGKIFYKQTFFEWLES